MNQSIYQNNFILLEQTGMVTAYDLYAPPHVCMAEEPAIWTM